MSAQNDTAMLRMFLMVLGALVAFTVIILILANLVISSVEEERGEDPRLRAAIAKRIQPVGSVNVAVADAAPAAPKSGAEIVATACVSCHGAGVLGAPKIGDQAVWSQRLAAQGGVDGLTASAITGKGGMPPKGGAMVSDGEIRAAIVDMLSNSGVDVDDAGAVPVQADSMPAGPVDAAKEMAGDAADAVVDTAKSMAAAVMPASESAPAAEPAAAEAPAAAPAPVAASAADLEKGKAVYGSACFVCHTTGAAGAPKLGDKAIWAPRIAQGMEVLKANSLKGKGAMPPKGGRMDIPDADVMAAVAYMVSQGQ